MKKLLPAFTLVETLIAIAVLTVAIAIPYESAERALIASYTARDQLTAASLAQEGLEFVRSVRDSNYISNYNNINGIPVSWIAELDGTNGGTGSINSTTGQHADCIQHSCAVDPYYYTIQQCSNANCSDMPLNIYDVASSNLHIYTQAGRGVPSRFSRAISIKEIDQTLPSGVIQKEAIATVTVYWKTNKTPYQVKVTEYMDNWLQ